MNRRIRSIPLLIALTTITLVAASCAGSTESSATTTFAPADTGTPVASEVTTDSTTTLAPTTTVALEITVAPETTVEPRTTPATTAAPATTGAPAPLTLRTDSIGNLEFGTATADQLLDTLSPALGNAISIEPLAYPDNPDPSFSYYENTAEERGFAYPFGTDICFGNGLCAYLGGTSADAVTLVGYRQSEGSGALETSSGVTAGSQGSLFPGIIIPQAGGCYWTGGGTADGVSLFLESAADPFGYFDDVTDEYVSQAPAVDDVSVIAVLAGIEPFFLYDDC